MSLRASWKPGSAHNDHLRSPSPPPSGAVDWFEPRDVTAAISAHNDKTIARSHKRRRQDGSRDYAYIFHPKYSASNGAMDTLSSVALEYGPTSPYSHRHSASAAAGRLDGERASKRVKSEKFRLVPDGSGQERPTTSYTRPAPSLAQPTSAIQDAELLVNFFNFARTTPSKPSPGINHSRSMSFDQSPTFLDRSAYSAPNEPLPQRQSTHMKPPPNTTENMQPLTAPQSEAQSSLHTRPFHEKNKAQHVATWNDGLVGINIANGEPGPVLEEHVKQLDTSDTLVNTPLAATADEGQHATNPLAGEAGEPKDSTNTTIHQAPNGDIGSANDNDDHASSALGALQERSGDADSKPTITIKNESEARPYLANGTGTTLELDSDGQLNAQAYGNKTMDAKEQICAACGFHRNNLTLETENELTSWISCDGCNKWFHFLCAGFKSEREVRSVDKFRCKACKPIHGSTTYVRKSARAHAPIDYAELNQGVVKTSEESPEHHYIKPIKEGTIKFTPESFARIRPELITTDFWLRGDGMKEPVVIPAEWNSRPQRIPIPEDAPDETTDKDTNEHSMHDQSAFDSEIAHQFEYEQVPDDGQDALDMVIPQDLTVRRVAELYGPEEKLEVIDVKSQNGEDKRWNMRKWADYYESDVPNKPVRNVISLEVSQSKLGRLIRRPKVVRELDLQDSVWPDELMARGDYPKVQFYCLMSVADCYTDFHIDFGGSSVYYHIIKGKKTFFFIPPTETNLKKYEDWCNSDAQNYTFLGDQTKTCYRVDLGPGDTMLIPAGWIHAVWTPEDSLVIGGNFLTRQNFPMQIRITQIEKATGVARKFRYPSFQKVMWYTAIKYMAEDPIPQSVVDLLLSGQKFEREFPNWEDYDAWGANAASAPGTELYNTRYYPKCELDGLPELARYIQRTAYIAAGYVTDGVSSDTKRAVLRSIPKEYKQHGSEPVDCVRRFAMWYCWKRGNELLPHWAYPDYVPETNAPEVTQKKLSAAHVRRLQREAAMSAERVSDRPQRERKQPANLYNEMMTEQEQAERVRVLKASSPVESSPLKSEAVPDEPARPTTSSSSTKNTPIKKRKSSGGAAQRQPACEACRKGRRACKHKDMPLQSGNAAGSSVLSNMPNSENGAMEGVETSSAFGGVAVSRVPSQALDVHVVVPGHGIGNGASQMAADNVATSTQNGLTPVKDGSSLGRSKACADCRKSKRRCIHDEYGRQDPVKMAQAAQPRPAAKKKRPSDATNETASTKKSKKAGTPRHAQSSSGEQSPTAADLASHMAFSATAMTQQPTPNMPSETLSHPDEEAVLTSVKIDTDAASDAAELQTAPLDTSSALVSPPESAPEHERTESPTHTPRPTVEGIEEAAKDRDLTPPTTASAPRSRRSSQLPVKSTMRQSPIQSRSRAMSTGSSDDKALHTMDNRRASSNALNEVDDETLRVIKDLAAQDRGLRRRESRPA